MIQTQLSAAERLRPTASPTQAYVQPKEASSGAEFARALSSLNPALDKIADKLAEDERERQEASVEGKIGGMTFDQFKEARAKDPTLGFTGKWARAALDKQYGIRMGHEVRRQVEQELATADMTTSDPEEFLAQRIQAAQGDLGDSKFTRAGFAGVTAGLLDKVRDKVNEDRIGRTVQNRNDNARENFLGTIEWAAGELADPEAMLHVVRQQYKNNRDLIGISYDDQDKLVGEVMKTMAQRPGMEKYVQALGDLDRGGVRLSTKLGSTYEVLKDSAKAESLKADNEALQDDFFGWMDAASSGDATRFDEKTFLAWADSHPSLQAAQKFSIIERFRSEQEQQVRHAQAQLDAHAKDNALIQATPSLVDLARQGHIAEIAEDVEFTTPSGKVVTLTKQELRERGLREAAQQIEREGKSQGLSQLAIRQNVIANYAKNGEVDPLTQSRVSALLNASAADGDLPQTMLDYLPELAATRAAAPGMIDQIATSESSRRFLDALTTGLEYELPPNVALAGAKFRRDNPPVAMPTKERTAAVDSVLSRYRNANKLFGQIGFGRAVDDPQVTRLIGERLDYFYGTGAQGSDLAKKVAESIDRTHVYMGHRLVDVSGTGVHASQARPVLQDMVTALKEAQPGLSKEDIIMMPMGRGSTSFRAVSATGFPIAGTERSWKEMLDLYGKRQTQRRIAKGRMAQDHRAARTEYWASDRAGAGAPGSMIDPIN